MEFFIDPVSFLAEQTGIDRKYIHNLITLIEGGATIPFIARYRKEMTGSMDEVSVEKVQQMYVRFQDLEKRKASVLDSIRQQGKLTEELEAQICRCTDAHLLEDIYLPFKPKKQTRAAKAKEKGLEPLAAILMRQENGDVENRVMRFVKGEVKDEGEALQGARDIIAEWVNESEAARNRTRRQVEREAVIWSKVVKGKEKEGEKFADYFDFRELLKRCPSHRILAIRRGEAEGILKVGIEINDEQALEGLERIFVKNDNEASGQVRMAVKDAYKRLLFPAMETENLQVFKEKADEEAIRVFAENLRQLLLAPPLGTKRVLGIDPGFRTGCKVVCLDETGQLLHNETIYPHPPHSAYKQAATKIVNMVSTYNIQAIAIGNGTAGRETETFIQNLRYDRKVQVFVVSESGASVYSASKIAREEFPEYDVTVRGAVSIGRRLMDPLAELVKIDPKSIGVGQYQHDVDQTRLKESLDRVVESCVNQVGVNVNTASKYLLTYVSGLGPALADNIVEYIREHGKLKSREELKNVKRMGAKAFEQCAGFLRVEEAENPLDNSAVHPESYYVVEKIARDFHVNVKELIGNEELCGKINPSKYVDEKTGLLTLKDIVAELRKPGRDPRSMAKVFSFAEGIHTIEDLQEGMVLPGIVTNITNFGAFVDVGVHQDGLVHISEMADRYVSSPTEVLKLHQQVMVKVIQLDKERRRIGLSIRQVKGEG
ncbi:Tex family protein [Odoribacter lunatus]|uniref:Tex family protein n=1 Tax=Odoribacter lunatus TaxID=2941335 RepID=UPI00203F9D98|nr:Tex family protein [Odoribacter lunatus]